MGGFGCLYCTDEIGVKKGDPFDRKIDFAEVHRALQRKGG
jgi:hypothetical protein